jgi:ankyrin repeat protein
MQRLFLSFFLLFLVGVSISAHGDSPRLSPQSPLPLSPDRKTSSGAPESQLLGAALQGQTRRVTELLAQGVSPDARDQPGGLTPLMMASVGDFQATVKVLLAAGANPNLQRYDGVTALMMGAVAGAEHAVALLVSHSNLEARDDEGNTALTYAALNDRTDVIDILFKAGADVNTFDSDGQTPLHHAVREDQTEAVEHLLKARAKIDARDNWGQTPMFIAAVNGFGETARRLIDGGASPEATDGSGRTPLQWAVLWNDEKTVGALLDHGASIDRRAGDYDSGVTALILAAWTGKPNLVKLLIQHGANPNITDSHNETALHWAAATDQADSIQILLAAGADDAIRNFSGQTALDVALYEGRARAAEVLAAHKNQKTN